MKVISNELLADLQDYVRDAISDLLPHAKYERYARRIAEAERVLAESESLKEITLITVEGEPHCAPLDVDDVDLEIIDLVK